MHTDVSLGNPDKESSELLAEWIAGYQRQPLTEKELEGAEKRFKASIEEEPW